MARYCPEEQNEMPELQLQPSGYWVCSGCGQIFGQRYHQTIAQWKDHLIGEDKF